MNHRKRQRWVNTLGLSLTGAFAVGAVVLTGTLVKDNSAFAAAAEHMDRGEVEANRGGSRDDAPSHGAPTDAGNAQLPTTIRVAQADTDDNAADSAPVAEDGAAKAEEPIVEEEKCCKKGDKTPPFELIKETPPGELRNPYNWRELKEEHKDDPDYLVKQFRLPGCNACHGNSGGGAFCPTLSQGVWLWGNTDDVLFRLIALGSAELQKQGWTRYQDGAVKAPMPEMGQVIKTSDHLWKIITFIRSINPPNSSPPEKVMPGKYSPPTGETKAE